MDAKIHTKIIKYNIITIISLLTSISGFKNIFELFTATDPNYDLANLIVLTAIAAILGGETVINFNSKSMKKYICVDVASYLEANNINLDFEYDEGGATLENQSFFPYAVKGTCTRSYLDFDLSKYGQFDDLGFSYSIDKFSASATQGSGKYSTTIYSKVGIVINFEFTENINENAVVISSESFDTVPSKWGEIYSEKFIPALKDYSSETIGKANKIIIFSKENDFDKYKKIKFSHEIFLREFHMVINKNTVSIFTPKDKFKIKMPIILTKGKFERLISDEKRKIYNFNTYLYDLAFIFKDI